MSYTRENLLKLSYEELLNKVTNIDLQTCSKDEMADALLIMDIICLGEKRYENDQLVNMDNQKQMMFDVFSSRMAVDYYRLVKDIAEKRYPDEDIVEKAKEYFSMATDIADGAAEFFDENRGVFTDMAATRAFLKSLGTVGDALDAFERIAASFKNPETAPSHAVAFLASLVVFSGGMQLLAIVPGGQAAGLAGTALRCAAIIALGLLSDKVGDTVYSLTADALGITPKTDEEAAILAQMDKVINLLNKKGPVDLRNSGLSLEDQEMIVLAAKDIIGQLDPSVDVEALPDRYDSIHFVKDEGYVQGDNGSSLIIGRVEENDSIRGGSGADVILGFDGNDVLRGEGGDDHLEGGAGEDTLYGGSSDDKLYGGAGEDTIYGDDSSFTERGEDELHGGAGNDSLYGGESFDKLYGDSGNDDLFGGHATKDSIDRDIYGDELYGGDGDDHLYGDGNNEYSGEGATSDLLGHMNGDKLYGGNGNDTLYGGGGADELYGDDLKNKESGNDTLYGGSHDDKLYGGQGEDYLYGGEGNDTLHGGAGHDRLFGGAGDDEYLFDLYGDGLGKHPDIIIKKVNHGLCPWTPKV